MSLQRAVPPFRADQVGSLLRPTELLTARERRSREEISDAALRAIEDQSIREIVRLQEEIGFQAVTDGEFRRGLWHADFLEQFENVAIARAKVKVRFHTEQGDVEREPTTYRVTGKLARPKPIFVEHFKFLKSIARGVPKITIPSPSIFAFPAGARGRRSRRLSGHGGFLRRSGRRFPRGDRRPCRRGLSLSSDRRNRFRLPLRSEVSSRKSRIWARIRRRCPIPMRA